MQDTKEQDEYYMVVADFVYKNENRENNLEIIDYNLTKEAAEESKKQALKDSVAWTDWEVSEVNIVKQGEYIWF